MKIYYILPCFYTEYLPDKIVDWHNQSIVQSINDFIKKIRQSINRTNYKSNNQSTNRWIECSIPSKNLFVHQSIKINDRRQIFFSNNQINSKNQTIYHFDIGRCEYLCENVLKTVFFVLHLFT